MTGLGTSTSANNFHESRVRRRVCSLGRSHLGTVASLSAECRHYRSELMQHDATTEAQEHNAATGDTRWSPQIFCAFWLLPSPHHSYIPTPIGLNMDSSRAILLHYR